MVLLQHIIINVNSCTYIIIVLINDGDQGQSNAKVVLSPVLGPNKKKKSIDNYNRYYVTGQNQTKIKRKYK